MVLRCPFQYRYLQCPYSHRSAPTRGKLLFYFKNEVKRNTLCLGSVELVFEKRLQPFIIKCILVERCCKSRIQWSTQTCLEIARFLFTSTTNTVGHLWESHFDSHKWPTVLVRKVSGQPRNFVANLCGSLYSTFKTSFQRYAFYNKPLYKLFL